MEQCNNLILNKYEKALKFNNLPYIMGILNVTPDSFSDGGEFFLKENAIKHGLSLIENGANILDIGGESTRPFSHPVSKEEEVKRVIPVIKGIKDGIKNSIISIDTYKASVAIQALDAGADIINDISGLGFDPEMPEVAASYNVPVIIMHIKGTPQNMQVEPFYHDIWEELISYFQKRIDFILKKGVKKDKIILDPGIGFGKRPEDNIQIIKGLNRLKNLGFPVLIGNSRKSFIGKISGIESSKDRDVVSLIADIISIINGADVIRTHNVKNTRDALKIYNALK